MRHYQEVSNGLSNQIFEVDTQFKIPNIKIKLILK